MRIAVLGATGRMGQAVIRALLEKDKTLLSGGHIGKEKNKIGKDLGTLAGMEPCKAVATDRMQTLFAGADAVIDFTAPECVEEHCQFAKSSNTALVVGTTGLTEEHLVMLRDTAETVPVVWAPNMSLGVNILCALVQKAAAVLDADYDIEIFEAHHKFKKDAPSGTALALAQYAAKGRGIKDYKPAYDTREGERKKGAIGFAVMRGGDIVGEHDVVFAAGGERLILSHKATDRAIFARGAVTAALWTKGKAPGFYSMQDVLGLK